MFSIAINIGINIPFIRLWGAEGAAYGTLLAGIFSGAVSFYFSQKYFKIKWEYKKIGYVFFYLFLFSFSTILFRKFEIIYPIRLLIKLFYIGLYLVLGLTLSIITEDLLKRVKYQLLKK
jgi:O-antigen/teichoic acid export membrane protein